MKTMLLSFLLTTAAGIATAAPVLTLAPGGPVTGPPGSAVGWGFSLKADATEWISVIGSFTTDETNSSLGFYVDLIGTQGGPAGGALPPGNPDWVQSFDLAALTGLGYFQIFPDAPPQAVSSGNIHVLYERFSADPTTCGDCLLGSGGFVVPFAFTVGSNVPEPATWILLAFGLAALTLSRRTAS